MHRICELQIKLYFPQKLRRFAERAQEIWEEGITEQISAEKIE